MDPISSRWAGWRRVAWVCGICLGLLASGAPDADQVSCPPVPGDVVLRPGQSVRLGDAVFELVLASRDEEGRISLDLLARLTEAETRLPRPGSYIPHLDVEFDLRDADVPLAAGHLEFRVSDSGPSYGTDLASDELGHEEPILRVSIRSRSDGIDIEAEPDCPVFPIELRFALGDAPTRSPDVAPAPTASADDARIQVVSNFDPLPQISSPYSDVWGYSDGSTHLAMLGSNGGTYFVDVTDAANPVEVSFIAGPSSGWRDIKTYLHYAYIVTEGFGPGQGLQIVDLSNPLVPVLVNTWSQTFATAHNVYIDEAIGQAWIVGADSGTRILDLGDPVNPVEVGSRSSPYVHDAFVADGLAYLSQIFDGTHEIVDASDPSNLETLSLVETPTAVTHNSWTNDDRTLLVTTDESNPGGHLGIWDITDKSDPVLLSEYSASDSTLAHNAIFDDDDGHRIAMSYYAVGLRYIDVRVPTMPIELGAYDTYPQNDNSFNGAWGVYPFDPRGYLFVSDRSTGLYVLEYAPTGGVLSGRVSDAASEEPLAGVQVLILPAGVSVVTDDDGSFGSYVDEGSVELYVKAAGYKTQLVSAGAMPLGGSVEVDIDLEPLPTVELSGSVRRPATLEGIARATVALPGTSLVTTTDAGGAFTFPAVPIGQRAVTADAFGFAPQESSIVLAAGRPATLDLLLEPGSFVDRAETDLGWGPAPGFVTPLSGAWVRVDPNGTGGGTVQPENDHTPDPGLEAFITGQSPPGAGVNDNDVEGGVAGLLSPALDLTGLDAARLRLHRWVSNSAGVFAVGSLRIQASGDGVNFVTLELLETEANSWVRREFDLGSVIALSDQARLRLLAEPGPFDPATQVLECGVDDIDIVDGCAARFSPELPDSDGDRVVDACDTCPLDVANDGDGDGFCGDVDNTPFVASPDQADGDGDGVGDVADNCESTSNADQRDLDGDGRGDACDDDVDGDSLDDAVDPDDDNDGIPDGLDVCPSVPDAAQYDADDDGAGDACDDDDGIVQGVRFGADGLIVWEPESDADSYNLYRGDLGPEILLSLAQCRIAGVPASFYVDLELPNPGEGSFYLVSRVSGVNEGSLGRKSSGFEREVNSPCP